MNSYKNTVPYLLLFIISIRLVAVAVTITTGQNPYAQADIFDFIASAEQIATGLERGEYVRVERSSTYQRWGTFLAPFWLLPGPSLVYASVANALVGSFAIYNVYVISRYYHSRYAGVLTAVPLALYPSIVMVHATPIRDTFILFGITVAARTLLVPSRQNRIWKLSIAAIGLALATLHRPNNIIIYAIAIGAGTLVHAYRSKLLRKSQAHLSGVVGFISILVFVEHIQKGILYLAELRARRARGRTAYLVDVYATKIPEAIAFSWVGMAYFLFTPFPWMISAVSDFVVGIEALGNLFFALASPLGFRVLFHRNPAGAVGLGVGLLVGVVLYGFGTANVGTAVRHRQMFLWAIFLFGGIGIVEHIRIEVSGKNE